MEQDVDRHVRSPGYSTGSKGLWRVLVTVPRSHIEAPQHQVGCGSGSEGAHPVVGYVDRQKTGRRLSPEAHQGVIQMFEALHAEGKLVFKHLHFEDFLPQQQLAQVAPVDVSFRRAAQLMIDSDRCAWQRLDASSLDEARVHCH